MNLRQQWNYTCQRCEIKPLSTDTAARILAIIYFYNNESLTHNGKLRADVEYIMDEYNIKGGDIPSEDIRPLIKKYIQQLINKNSEWAVRLMKDNYNITLYNE